MFPSVETTYTRSTLLDIPIPQPTGEMPREVYTVEDNASSVEVTEEVYNTKGNPVTGAPRTGDTVTPVPSGDELTPSEVGLVEEVEPDLGDGQDKTRREMGTHLKSPLELGLLPPFCTNDSPSDSGENQDQGEEPDEESGIESNVTDESPGVRSLPPRQERRPESHTYKVFTAAMKKGKPVSDLKDVLKAGIDPRKMPMNPENAPHSLLQSRRNQSVEREERLRAQGVSRPVALINVSRPVEPDSTHLEEVPQTKEEVEASIKEWIRRANTRKQTPQPQSPTGQQKAHDTPQTSTSSGGTKRGKKKNRTRITDPVQTRNIRDRLGPPLNLVFTSKLGTTPWNRQIEGLEPEEGLEPGDPKQMTQQELIDKVIRLRSTREDKDPESTDDSKEEQ